MEKRSFVLTGYVERSTCNCGCVSNNCFWQDGGFGGTNHLSLLHQGIEKYLDELSGAGSGEKGKPCDVKVTITIEPLGGHDHRVLNRRHFSGLGFEDNKTLKEKIAEPSPPENEVRLKGEEQFKKGQRLTVEISTSYLEDIHDGLLLVRRTGDLSKLEGLQTSLQEFLGTKKSRTDLP